MAQTVVGMGTDQPNSNAVLDLQAKNHNQGFLVPRLTTAQRIASSFTSLLSDNDNGLLVFDTDAGSFYFWHSGDWQRGMSSQSAESKLAHWYTDSTAPDNNLGNNGDFYMNSATGDLYRKEDGQYIKMSNMINTGDQQNLNMSLAQGNILVGGSNGISEILDAKTSGSILVGNGTTLASVQISGDLVLQANGTLTLKNLIITTDKIANDAITKDKINADVAGNGLAQNADGSLEINIASMGLEIEANQLQLSNKEDGQLLIGNNKQVVPTHLSGDIALAADGSTSIQSLQGNSIAATTPNVGETLVWDGNQWVPQQAGTQWFSGINKPNETNPAAANGSFYYRINTQTVFYKENDSWSELGKWQESNNSIPETFVSNNNSDPDNDLGKVGDFYIKANTQCYIKTKTNQWEWFTTF